MKEKIRYDETEYKIEVKTKDNKPFVVFDLDGTIYDSLQSSIDALNNALTKLRYPCISKQFYLNTFQTNDWKRFYIDLGIKEKDVDKVISLFRKFWSGLEPPSLIPEALPVFEILEAALGKEHIHFVTNEKLENVLRRFNRDGLEKYIPFVKTSSEGKAKAIFALAKEHYPTPLIYIGDLVSDGEECLKARDLGALNVFFFGIIHQHSLNAPQKILNFTSNHCEYCGAIPNLNQLATMVHLLKSSLIPAENTIMEAELYV